MKSIFPFTLSLRASKFRRAIPKTSISRVPIQDDALFLCPMSMHGADGVLAAYLISGSHEENERFSAVTEPRPLPSQSVLWGELSDIILPYIDHCYQTGRFPQLIVPTKSCIAFLRRLGQRMLNPNLSEKIRKLGRYIAFSDKRSSLKEQASIISADTYFCSHFTTGSLNGNEQNIKSLHVWLEGIPAAKKIHQAMEEAEKYCMKELPTAEDDLRILKLISEHRKAYSDGQKSLVASIQEEIEQIYEPILREQLKVMKDLIGAVENDSFEQNNAYVQYLYDAECYAFQRSYDVNTQGMAAYNVFANRESTYQSHGTFFLQESATEILDALELCCDTYRQAEAKYLGHLIDIEITETQKLGRQHLINATTTQNNCHIRRNEQFYLLGDKSWSVIVESIQHHSNGKDLKLRMCAGQRKHGLPELGQILPITKIVPDQGRVQRNNWAYIRRRRLKPQTHESQPIVGQKAITNQNINFLQQLEEQR